VHSQEKPKWPPSPHVAATEPLRPEEQLKKFHLPLGFEIQLVAADPDIRKPINIAFDAAGRLWLTETVEYPFAAEGRPGRDGVKILEDFGPDGRARKITTFADGLNIPIGVLPLDTRTALVYSIPAIYRLTDTDGDGKADKREPLLTGFGHKDTHGMTGEFQMGFDGWVYACHGYANKSVVKGTDGSTITMESGNTYRFKPDGTRVQYFTHGQVNPFGLAFDPYGNLYSTDCHTRPLYQLLRGAWYPSFGKPHDGLGFGPEMVKHDHGSTAIGGIAYYAADQYPPEFRDNLFVGNVVTNRINRDRLEKHGSTRTGIEMPDFVKSDDPWFRPVDIKLGPDGCLYVADFYNRIIGHYEVPLNHPGRDRDKGRIWRIVYRGPDGRAGPQPVRDLSRASLAELVEELNNPNLAVRLHATHVLVEKGGPAGLQEIRNFENRKASAFALGAFKIHSLWVRERLGQLDDATLSEAAKSWFSAVSTHAMRILTERPKLSQAERDLAVTALTLADGSIRRTAVEVLGAHAAVESVAPLLRLRHQLGEKEAVDQDDTHLLHVVRMALRDQLRLESAWSKLPAADWKEKDYRAIADVCLGVHNTPSAEFLKDYLQKYPERGDTLQRYCQYIVRHGKDDAAAWVHEYALAHFAKDAVTQGQLLKAIQQASQERGIVLAERERAWAEPLVNGLVRSTKNPEAQLGIELAGALKLASAQPALLARAKNVKLPEAQRKSAIATLVSLAPSKSMPPLLEMLLVENENLAVREQVAVSLANSNQAEAHTALVKALQVAPAPVQLAIARGLAGSMQGGERLVEAVETGKASPRLLQDLTVVLRLRQAKIGKLDDRLARLTKGLAPADQRLQELLVKRRDAFTKASSDETVGRKVFEKNCASCHQIANQGAKIGPQLDGIGIRGVERLLEDVLDPNRNVDQAFRSTMLVLENGQLVSGLLLREEGEVVILADAQGKEQRVSKNMIQERQVSALSPMPSNFAEQISEPDFYHLLAYLLAQRAKQ
jgi:putative heme-binding domain-containing protein